VSLAVEPSLSIEVKLLTGSFALGLTLVHLFAGQLRFLETIPRSRWLSLASGISEAINLPVVLHSWNIMFICWHY
jgi:hypothetical protein